MIRDEGFLSRWSRRKAEAKTAPEELPPVAAPRTDKANAAVAAEPARDATPAAAPDMQRDAPPDEETRQTWIARLEAIDLESLTYTDDFTIFMKDWVPQAVRNRALRRLWRTSDVFDGLDGLVDYGDDFAIAPAAVGSITSSWQPGRGFAPGENEPAAPEEEAGSETAGEAADQEAAAGDDSPPDDRHPADAEAATGKETPGSGKASG